LLDCDPLPQPIYVHRGFQRALGFTDKKYGKHSLYALIDLLDRIDFSQRSLYVTGHSLGGAIATLFVAKLRAQRPELVKQSLRRVVTFGAPAVGLKRFRDYYAELNEMTLRIVNAADAVPYSPPAGYYHVGTGVWLLDGEITEDPGWRTRLRLAVALASPASFISNHSMSEYIAALSQLADRSP
jgi:predicted lipase